MSVDGMIILSLMMVFIISLFKLQDEKPSVITQQIQQMYQKTQLVLPNKEVPKPKK